MTNNVKQRNVLVMGGSGFLGSQLVRRLQGLEEYQVFAPSHKELDACEYSQIVNFIKNNQIDIVIHAVANHAGIGTGVNQELYFLESNLLMNSNLVKASYESGIEKFITFGTSCCYNNPEQVVFTEEDYWKNKSEISYGTCKRVMLEQLQLQNAMNWVYLVPPNLYGPGDHFGEKHTHFVPATYKKFDDAIKENTGFITVWGDGSQMRDFLFVEDLIDIILKSIESEILDRQVMNIATMKDSSVKEVVTLIRETLGYMDIEIKWDTSKPTGVGRKVLDNSKFLSLIPDFKFTNINFGIETISKWHLNGDSYEGLL
ncbi:MAG: NAD-dependent epimerase/dehydratase family protein [Lachnospiraceae bacterium]|nr:NAD-dependent epimerase/dehydratase family protein [Lachnospiraceae bacterium]